MIKCRACLKDEGDMVSFSDQHIYYFNLLTDIHVQVSDKLPQHLCLCCFEKMKSFIEFREKCISSNYLLIESSESKHKIDVDVVEEYKSDVMSTNSQNETLKRELNIDNIDEILEDDIVNENKHLDYDLLNDLIKTENFEEQIRTSKRKRITKKNSKKKISSINTFCELETKNEGKIKLSKNMVLKNKETLLSCGLCSQTFPEMNLLSIHLSSHKTTNKCNLCSQKFTDWPALLSHRLIHLTNKEKRCHICLNRFYKPLHMEYHYKQFHTEDKNYIVKCSECSHSFKSPRKLQKHVWSCHSEKTFLCEHCPKIFKSKNAIKIHMPIHNTKHHLACDLCDYTCRFSSNLKDHKLRKHTPKKTYCKKCTRVFSSQEKLDAHKCGERGTVCHICGKVGKTHRQLARHLASHGGGRRHCCDRCPATYRSGAALAAHRAVHDGIRTKHCDLCAAKFFSASVLIKHRRTHTGEKPYVCRVCCRGFTGNYNLKVHMRVHGEYLIEKKKSSVTVVAGTLPP